MELRDRISTGSKVPDYIAKLTRLIRKQRDANTKWGKPYCVLWVLRCLSVVHGFNARRILRLSYKDASDAKDALARYGFDTTQEAAQAVLGQPKPIMHAKYGDIVSLNEIPSLDVIDAGLGRALGVCYGSVSFFASSAGLVSIPTRTCFEAYNG